MKKITLSLKNIWNTPKNRIPTVVGFIATISAIIAHNYIDQETLGGVIVFSILAALAGGEDGKKAE